MRTPFPHLTALIALLLLPSLAFGAEADTSRLDLTGHWVGFTAIAVFVLAYMFVMAEEFTHLRKSKPVMLAAGIIWVLVAWVYSQNGLPRCDRAMDNQQDR